MDVIKWNEGFSVGITEFDDDHKYLIDLVNKLVEGRNSGQVHRVLVKILEELINYTVEHFNREETLLKISDYPTIDQHIECHEKLKAAVLEFYESYKSGAITEISDDVLRFLNDWLVNHILNDDKAYGSFLNFHGIQSIHDRRKVERRNISDLFSIRASSIMVSVLLAVIIGVSAVAGWKFLTGVREVMDAYEHLATVEIVKVRTADYLYGKFSPDGALWNLNLLRNAMPKPSVQGVDPLDFSIQEGDTALERYRPLITDDRERKAFDIIAGTMEALHTAIRGSGGAEQERTAIDLAPATDAVRDLNHIAYEEYEKSRLAVAGRVEALVTLIVWTAAINGTLIVFFGLFWQWFSRWRLVPPLSTITNALVQLAGGNLEASAPAYHRTDEIGQLANAFQILHKNAVDVKNTYREQERLRSRLTNERHDALASLARDFQESVQRIVDEMFKDIGIVQNEVGHLSGVAETTTRQSADALAKAGETSSSVDDIASDASRLATAVEEIANHVSQATLITHQAVERAEKADALIQVLADSSQRIGEVVQLINAIAQQTNLLALNATIEAARAGEAGKGFAVVASEVKSLAGQTAKATDEISSQVTAIQSVTADVVSAIRGTGEAIHETNTISETVAGAVQRQAEATNAISGNAGTASAGAQETSQVIDDTVRAMDDIKNAIERMIEQVTDLSQQTDHLKSETGHFLVKMRAVM